jgi:sulfoxide reductase heme-binding subunit YedZ
MLRYFKPVIFLACLAPLGMLVWRGFHSALGANPIEAITHFTGDWTLTFLLITLSITPLRRITRQYWLIGLRRMLGLFAFFYGTLHLTTYVWLDKFFDVHEMLADIAKRKFITAGMTAFTLMIPLALTSTKWSIRKLGGKRWQALHRLIYAPFLASLCARSGDLCSQESQGRLVELASRFPKLTGVSRPSSLRASISTPPGVPPLGSTWHSRSVSGKRLGRPDCCLPRRTLL